MVMSAGIFKKKSTDNVLEDHASKAGQSTDLDLNPISAQGQGSSKDNPVSQGGSTMVDTIPSKPTIVDKGKPHQSNKINGVNSNENTGNEQNLFMLATQIEQILSGQSNKTCMKVLTMIGSLRGIRCIPIDRPIGQSPTGKQQPAGKTNQQKQPKGKPTPKAAWKMTEEYKTLSISRTQAVQQLKEAPPESKDSAVEKLREIEQQLKALRSPTAGNC